jgi:hypothetical protein
LSLQRLKGRTGKILPVIQLLGEEQVSHGGADVIRTEITPSMVGKDLSQKLNHGGTSGVGGVVHLETVSDQEEMLETQFVKIESGTSIWAVSVGKPAGSAEMCRGRSGIQ